MTGSEGTYMSVRKAYDFRPRMYRYSILEEEAQSVMFDHHSAGLNSSGDHGSKP